MNPSLNALLVAILWTETDEDDAQLDKHFSVSDFHEISKAQLSRRFSIFVNKAEKQITDLCGNDWSSIEEFYTGPGRPDFELEYDFIMSCNHHGCGFWEKYSWKPEVGQILNELAKQHGEIHAGVGEDGETLFIDFYDNEWEAVG